MPESPFACLGVRFVHALADFDRYFGFDYGFGYDFGCDCGYPVFGYYFAAFLLLYDLFLLSLVFDFNL